MPNTLDAAMAVLAPDFDYRLDEAASPYANNGSAGVVDLVWETGDDAPWVQAPGIVRGAPYTNGFWCAPLKNNFAGTAPGTPGAGFPDQATFVTGTFAVWAMAFSTFKSTTWTPLAISYRSDATIDINDSGRFLVNLSTGQIIFVVGPGSGNDFVQAQTAAGVFSLNTPYLITATQRGDGTGIHIHVNGVDVTDATSFGANTTINGFIDAIAANTLDAALVLNGVAVGTTASYAPSNQCHALMQRPAIWVNNGGLSDSQILGLFASAGGLDTEPQDYYEYMLDRFVVDAQAFYWLPGFVSNGTGDFMQSGALTPTGHQRISLASPDIANIVETNRISNFVNYKQRFGTSTTFTVSGGTSADLSSDTVGTVSLLLTINSHVSDGDIQWVWVWGEGSAAPAENVGLYLLGDSALGTGLVFTIGELSSAGVGGAAYYQIVIQPDEGAFDILEPLPAFVMLTITQDGTGFKIYKNGVLIGPGTVISVGGTYVASSWFDALVSPITPDFALGYPGSLTFRSMGTNLALGATEGQDVHDVLVDQQALSQTAITELWNAVLGIFPALAAPPANGFHDTLITTGNNGDPNGPGPDHYWRENAITGPLPDIGISTIVGDTIATGGDPLFRVQGPLIVDPTNFAIYFDGAGDYFEVGVDGITGQLVTFPIGTVGFFMAINSLTTDNIAYSQADAAGAQRIQWGVNNRKPEFFVQTSAGNSARLTATNEVDRDFVFVVMTNDGANYLLYIDGAVDPGAVLVLAGTGLEGDWFDSITATRSAIGALATSTFITETTGRSSETFIYDEVLTAGQIAALFAAAVRDGIGGLALTQGVVSFEDVIFENGGRSDIRALNPRTDFNQILLLDNCRFIGGVQNAAAQSLLVSGEARVQIRGSDFDLNDTPVAGRAAIQGTVADPTDNVTTFGSLVVTDSTFSQMGRAADPAIYMEAGFGLTVDQCRFIDCLGSAMGWRGDARRVIVRRNIIEGVTAALAAIYVRAGLNTQIGTAWLIDQNIIADVLVGGGILIEGANSSAAAFARNLNIRSNMINAAASEYLNLHQISDALVQRNRGAGGAVDGLRVRSLTGLVALRHNTVRDHSGDGIVASEASLQTAALILEANMINGLASADGITVGNISRATVNNNRLVNLANGLEIGTIGVGLKIAGNDLTGVVTGMVLSGAQTGLELGENRAPLLASQTLTVVANAVNVSGPFHTLTSGGVVNLATLGGPARIGMKIVLRMAVGSSNITLQDGVGDMRLASDFVMDAPGEDQLWLVYNGTQWDELARFTG